ncbi:MAG: 50S ribosomal protein L21 [Candidatus Marinimicrobia bacterium]|jgi:large subunit ribosomal protein L21|nr:50S ribosomal protein L21 [Candidatus Neomarinimicrobiota bacterium]MDP6167368.1 50S ribosomal protein L21 [Candidatus Neomarinimicrobiota bacterium]MDP6400914.1 50S ribosomal protein L21 [Candidatus Neomarinimicrobiota bacterium]MDP6614420.1 50S ribosomal protein L21 [Candidatus Neomarinimicrobiota bacterium]MDP6820480.1 50S ribosomal protein L21 [Candidatus Neomarinimicrobiota bacterium]
MYAIVNISGKQYKATEGARLRVPRQSGDSGAKLSFDDILLISNSDSTQVGKPNVSGAKVTATILNHGRERKILVYKKKRRKGYQRKNGHRQWYTELEVQKIQLSTTKKKAAPKKTAKPKPAAKEKE